MWRSSVASCWPACRTARTSSRFAGSTTATSTARGCAYGAWCDVFGGHLDGLVLAEVEFASAAEAAAFRPAAFCHAEVTVDRRFTGGELVRAPRARVRAWTAEYGIDLSTR